MSREWKIMYAVSSLFSYTPPTSCPGSSAARGRKRASMRATPTAPSAPTSCKEKENKEKVRKKEKGRERKEEKERKKKKGQGGGW